MNEITAGKNTLSFASLPKKDMAASVFIHIVAGFLLLAAPIMMHQPNQQTISMTFHEEKVVSDQPRSSVAARSARKDKAEPAVHRQRSQKPEKTNQYAQALPVVEKHPAEIFRDAANETPPDLKDVPKSLPHTQTPGSDSIAWSAEKGSTKIVQTQSGPSETSADARFGGQGAPSFIHQEMPVYPPLARRLGKEGRVLLKLLIDADGKLRQVEVVEAAGYGFTEASLDAVKRSTYAPGFQNGAKVAMRVLLPVSFRLQ